MTIRAYRAFIHNALRVTHSRCVKRQNECDVMIMNNESNNNVNDVNDVVTNANDDDASNVATRTRATTRALNDAKIKMTKTQNEKIVTIDENTNVKIVRTSSNALRIDHSLCDHAQSGNDGKRARSQCRARIAKMNAK